MQALLNAVRGACSKAIWSRGVELVRTEAVRGESESEASVTLRVATRGGLVSPEVTLYPEDEDWECTCRGEEDPCEHVAAAAIALNRARKDGKPLPRPSGDVGTLLYRFTAERSQLVLEREIALDSGRTHKLTSTLEAVARGRVDGPRFVARPNDIHIERLLGPPRGGALPRNVLPRLFELLADDAYGPTDIRFDGAAIGVSDDPVGLVARLVDAPGGVRLYVEQDPEIDLVFQNGAALRAETLHPLRESGLTGREREDLPRGRFYSDDQLPELVTEVLPDLETRIRVHVETARLPTTRSGERPRIRIEARREGDVLTLLPTLVYGEPVAARVDAGRLVHLSGSIPVRDLDAENAEITRLREQLGLVPGHPARLRDGDAIEFADRLAAWPGEVAGTALRDFHRTDALIPVLRTDGDRLDVSFESGAANGPGAGREDRQRVSADRVLRAWRSGSSLVSLDGGGFAPLPADWLSRFGHRISDLLAAREEGGRIPTFALPDLGRLCEELDQPPPSNLERLRPIIDDFAGLPAAELPDDLTTELRPYQRQGVDWLHFMARASLGALLADDMGLGKTVQALCALDTPALVVAPTSVLPNWQDEIRKFRPSLRTCMYHGTQRTLDPKADITLTSYALLRLDEGLLAEREWAALVLDEAQNIKNPESQVAQAAYRMPARFRIALTGTPVENRLDELWSQFHFLNPGLLGGRSDFQERYARPIAEGAGETTQRLRERIRPFLLRRLKRDVAPELPPRTDVVLHCTLSEAERQVYDAVRASTVSRVVEQLRAGGGVMAALEALLRLRQAACHSALVPGQEAMQSSKLDLLRERLELAAAEGHKALVFSQWTSLLDLVEPVLHAGELDFVRLDGTTRNRGDVVRTFQDDTGPPVMLVSLKAGGTGLNLTAADHIFLLDPWWNPAVEDQAADRAHRIGQTRKVVVHRLVSENTVEERILALHARKRALFEAAVGDASQGDGLSRDDLLALLES